MEFKIWMKITLSVIMGFVLGLITFGMIGYEPEPLLDILGPIIFLFIFVFWTIISYLILRLIKKR